MFTSRCATASKASIPCLICSNTSQHGIHGEMRPRRTARSGARPNGNGALCASATGGSLPLLAYSISLKFSRMKLLCLPQSRQHSRPFPSPQSGDQNRWARRRVPDGPRRIPAPVSAQRHTLTPCQIGEELPRHPARPRTARRLPLHRLGPQCLGVDFDAISRAIALNHR